MRPHLTVSTDHANVCRAEVPCSSMWDLVEYLSYQRIMVSYEYRPTHFVVAFPRNDQASAQQILDEWTYARSEMLEAVS